MSIRFALLHGTKDEVLLSQKPEELRTELLHRLDMKLPRITTRRHAVQVAREVFEELEMEFKELSRRV